MLAVIDEVTNTLIEEDGRSVREDGHVCFILEIDEGIFILSFNNADSTQIWRNNFEVECDAHVAEDVRRTSRFKARGSVPSRAVSFRI